MSSHDEIEAAKKKHPSHATDIDAAYEAILAVNDQGKVARAKAFFTEVMKNANDDNFDSGLESIIDQIHVITKWIIKGVK